MTIDELRAFCLSLPETHEKETWGDAEHAGDVTFRVRDKIYLITGQEGGSASIRTDRDQQADLLAAFPDAVRSAPYVGRFGWVSVQLDGLDPVIVRDVIVSAWRRTAPKVVVAAFEAGTRRQPPMTITIEAEAGTDGTAGAQRIAAAFARARADGRVALIPYVVAGYPDAETSLEIAIAAADAGADLLEVGLPYSDPLADGATLQRASGVALAAGATLEGSLRLIERIGAARPNLPLVPMGYANQVIGGGDGEAVAGRLARAGAAGLIVADLTPDEGAPFEAVARRAGLAVIYLVAPTTPVTRRAAIAARSGGFLYCVSLVGVTGARTSLPSSVGRLVQAVKAASPVPVAVGFGVSKPAHVRAIAKAGADGVIVASALVDSLGADGRDVDGLRRLVAELREATRVD